MYLIANPHTRQVNDPRHPPAQTKQDVRDGGYCLVDEQTGVGGGWVAVGANGWVGLRGGGWAGWCLSDYSERLPIDHSSIARLVPHAKLERPAAPQDHSRKLHHRGEKEVNQLVDQTAWLFGSLVGPPFSTPIMPYTDAFIFNTPPPPTSRACWPSSPSGRATTPRRSLITSGSTRPARRWRQRR
jgi:hypothetical protein